jgi:hypothetical protein
MVPPWFVEETQRAQDLPDFQDYASFDLRVNVNIGG